MVSYQGTAPGEGTTPTQISSAGGNPPFLFSASNFTSQQVTDSAVRYATELSRLATVLHLDMPWDLALSPRLSLLLNDTNSAFDGAYRIDSIERHYSSTSGSIQSFGLSAFSGFPCVACHIGTLRPMTERLSNAIKSHAASLDQTTGQIKFGTITSVNFGNATARVLIQPDGVLSGWLPIILQWVGNGWGMSCPPNPGDQVLLVPHEGDVEQGIIIGRSFSSKQMPPAAPGGEFWLVHETGSFLKLGNDGTIRLSGDLHVSGDVYDSKGSLSGLRGHYNSHTHFVESSGMTSAPSPLD